MSANITKSQFQDFSLRTEQLFDTIESLEKEVQLLLATANVAPPGSLIVRYLARGKKGVYYWYYKLQAPQPAFPTKKDTTKLSKYKHLGKAGSKYYLEAVEQVARRARIDGLQRAIDTLVQGSFDLFEEASKYNSD